MTQKNHHAVSLIIFAVFFFFSPIPALSDTSLSWLKLDNPLQSHYQISYHEELGGSLDADSKSEKTDVAKKILVIVAKRSKSYQLAANTLLSTFAQQDTPSNFRFVTIAKDLNRGQQLLAWAEEQHYDLIIAMGSSSAKLIHQHYVGGKLPVVSCINKDPVLLGQVADYDSGSQSNVAWTSLNVPLKIQMQYLKTLKPNLQQVALMYNANHSQVMATEVKPAEKVMTDAGITVFHVAVHDRKTAANELLSEVPKVMEQMKQQDPQLQNSLFWMTSSTAVFSEIAVIRPLAKEVPVIASVPNVVTEGDDSAVLAIGIDRRNNAHLAALYALEILQGNTLPGALPVGIVSPPDVAINFAVADDIGLKIPFSFFENAAFIYDYDGKPVRTFGQNR